MRDLAAHIASRFFFLALIFAAATHEAAAQDTTIDQAISQPVTQSSALTPVAADSDSEPSDVITMFPHSESSRYWISGQANIILQWHPTFPAKYTGTNSLSTRGSEFHDARSHALYRLELTHTTEVFADIEDATGGGIGNALGLAGYTNLDSVRLVQGLPLSKNPYFARLMLRQIIPLTDERAKAERDPLHLHTSVPARRIEFRIGKFDLVDFFDPEFLWVGQPPAIP